MKDVYGNVPLPVTPSARDARKRWAAFIKQICETDPVAGPKCSSEMKTIAVIGRNQTGVIEKILRHCGLSEEAPARAPPPDPEPIHAYIPGLSTAVAAGENSPWRNSRTAGGNRLAIR